MGLDPFTVRSISQLLHRLASKADPRLVLSLRPQDPVPDWITHLVVLGSSSRVLLQGTRAHAEKVFSIWSEAAKLKPGTEKKSAEDEQLLKQASQDVEAGHLDRQLIWDLHADTQSTKKMEFAPSRGGEPLIEMHGVRVKYGNKIVLGDWTQKVQMKPKKGLHWTVRRGQRWAVLGANGSGKTTLLSLITSDHPQAYSQPIQLFGRSRLPEAGQPGISIFELQSRIGHSSPEIHAFFPRQLTIRQAIESAYAETFLSRPTLTHDDDLDVSAIIRFFRPELDPNYNPAETLEDVPKTPATRDLFPKLGPKNSTLYISPDYDVDYADTLLFSQLSTAQQRVVLFARSLVRKPDIIILDEPFSDMSASMRDKCIHFLENGESAGTRASTATRRAGSRKAAFAHREFRVPEYVAAEQEPRHTGLSESQALIMVTHDRHDIPDVVRHYMRLPSARSASTRGSPGEQMDFRAGSLKISSRLSQTQVWEAAWAGKDVFAKNANRSYRRLKTKDGEQGDGVNDEDVYDWWSV